MNANVMTKTRPTMAKALRLTRAGNLAAATRLIQSALMGRAVTLAPVRGKKGRAGLDALQRAMPAAPLLLPAPKMKAKVRAKVTARPRAKPAAPPIARPPAEPGMGRFVEHSFTGPEGALGYWLYLPARPARGLPLLIMLHGCSQTPDDFARGTGMNLIAEEHGFIVAYPRQTASANFARCWNWFKPGDQQRDKGEPGVIAALTRAIIAEHGADAGRVYVAGLSAGGAAAAIMGATYPDIYAAIGVHSGLACGAASDMMSAFSAMRRGASRTPGQGRAGRFVPVITFHGDSDTTVHAVNSAQIVATAAEQVASPMTMQCESGSSDRGRSYTREIRCDTDGTVIIEQWTIHGAGHAWAGGNAAGSYTDASGPDASRALATFLLQHSLPPPG